ncbi:MAG: sensor histidine kinase, partial [Candidatus Hodarchaeales archaeon]
KTGSIVPVSIKSSVITEDKGPAVNAIVLLCRDITIQLEIEEERALAEQNRKELEERRIAFISMTSHELRTPLTSIKGYSDLLTRMNKDTEDLTLKKSLKAMNKNVARLERLIDGVLDVTQMDEQRFKIVKEKRDLISFIAETLNPYLNQVDSQVNYDSNSNNNKEIYVNIDPDRIAQVINNLVGNSLKNSPKNGGMVEIKVDSNEKAAKVIVTDQGAGIAAADLEKIFQKFVSIPTKYSVKGSGIGSYVSRMIIEAHSGSLIVSSQGLDKGSTFVIELPISHDRYTEPKKRK